MSDNTKSKPTCDAVGLPVEREVSPCGYVHGDGFIPHGSNGWTGGVPVYDQAALDAAVAAERKIRRSAEQDLEKCHSSLQQWAAEDSEAPACVTDALAHLDNALEKIRA